MDISETLAPKSDQLDYEDLIQGSRTFTIKSVGKGPSAEQPFNVHLVEHDRPWRPAKSMRRVLAAAWGTDATAYVGRKVTLFGDPAVKFGGQEVGGIRVSHLSHITAPLTVPLMVTRGKRAPFTVHPLTDPLAVHVAALSAAVSIGELQAAWAVAMKAGVSKHPELVALKDERKAALAATPVAEVKP